MPARVTSPRALSIPLLLTLSCRLFSPHMSQARVHFESAASTGVSSHSASAQKQRSSSSGSGVGGGGGGGGGAFPSAKDIRAKKASAFAAAELPGSRYRLLVSDLGNSRCASALRRGGKDLTGADHPAPPL